MLAHIVRRDPSRIAGRPNLTDAEWEVPEMREQAKQSYRRYRDLFKVKNSKAKLPKRVQERSA